MTRKMLDFYFAPSACSQAAHILLHEAGLPFRAHKVDIFSHQLTDGGDYLAVNPNGYVPALRLLDGSLLTENVALLDWIARQGASLVPPGEMGHTRHLQILAFVSTEMQKPFVRLFFSEDAAEKNDLRDTLRRRFDWLRSQIGGDFVFGDRFTASDAFVYVMLRWAAMLELEISPDFSAFARRMEQRSSVLAALASEEASPLH